MSLNSQELEQYAGGLENTLENANLSDLGVANVKQEVQQQAQQQVQQPLIYQFEHHDQQGYQLPDHFGRNPTLVKVQSNYAFYVSVPSEVVFSQNKLFIKMNSKMTFNVSYREQQKGERLFLRTMILFSKPAEMHLPVIRCRNHRQNHGNQSDAMSANIVKVNNAKAQYVGTEVGETFGDRLSVIIPLENGNFDEDGNITQMINIEFGCQSSCSSGINRRPTTLVFTLENGNYQLLGKGTQEFKVCSCPKRDAEREEKEKKELKRKGDTKPYPHGKKPKYERPEQKMQQPPLVKTEPESESDSNGDNSNTHSLNGVVPMSSVTVNLPTELVSAFLDSGFNIIAGRMQRMDAQQRTNSRKHYEKCMKDIAQMQKDFKRN